MHLYCKFWMCPVIFNDWLNLDILFSAPSAEAAAVPQNVIMQKKDFIAFHETCRVCTPLELGTQQQ